MDGSLLQISVFLAATFAAAFVAGVSGFAFALVAAAVWLHVLTPLQTATLISIYGMIVQGYGTWKMRRAFNWSRIWPFLVGGAPGVVIGVFVHHWANPAYLRTSVGVFLVGHDGTAFEASRFDAMMTGRGDGLLIGLGRVAPVNQSHAAPGLLLLQSVQ